MHPTTTLLLTAAGLYAGAALRREGRRRRRRPGAKPLPTRTELAQLHREASAQAVEDHQRSHRYTVMLNPQLRGSRCYACGEVFC